MSEDIFIEKQEMDLINQAKVKIDISKMAVENAVSAAKISELEYKNIILSIFNKYKLNSNNAISPEGRIITKEVAEDNSKEVAEDNSNG